jgi:hypothetical protein
MVSNSSRLRWRDRKAATLAKRLVSIVHGYDEMKAGRKPAGRRNKRKKSRAHPAVGRALDAFGMHGEQNGADAHLLLITRAPCSEGPETSNTTKSLIVIRSACMRGCFASSGVSETKAWMAPASFLPRFRLGRRRGLAHSERPRRARRPRTPASGRTCRRRRSCALSAPGA